MSQPIAAAVEEAMPLKAFDEVALKALPEPVAVYKRAARGRPVQRCAKRRKPGPKANLTMTRHVQKILHYFLIEIFNFAVLVIFN